MCIRAGQVMWGTSRYLRSDGLLVRPLPPSPDAFIGLTSYQTCFRTSFAVHWSAMLYMVRSVNIKAYFCPVVFVHSVTRTLGPGMNIT